MPTHSFARNLQAMHSMIAQAFNALHILRYGSVTCLTLFVIVCSSTIRAEPLTITGPETEKVFSQEDVLEISNQELVTSTPWTDGDQTFRGIPLEMLLEQAGIEKQGWLFARALNDYSINLPIEQLLEAQAFLAVQINGEFMNIRDNGPFWIVFPWNERPELLSRNVHAWSIWQLRSLTVMD
jgi:hypothetical protein